MVKNPKDFLDHLSRKKWLLKIRRGVYAVVPLEAGEKGADSYTLHSLVIGSLLTETYYIGYWSALNYHGMIEQTPPSVYIATPRPRNSRTLLDTHFVFVTVRPHKMFGIEETEIEGRTVKISSPEKTVVDCLDHPEHCGGTEEVAKAIYFSMKSLDPKKVAEFAKMIGNSAVLKRLGYISEAFKWNECLDELGQVRLKSGYSMLDPTRPRSGHIRERWKLVVNADLDPARWTG